MGKQLIQTKKARQKRAVEFTATVKIPPVTRLNSKRTKPTESIIACKETEDTLSLCLATPLDTFAAAKLRRTCSAWRFH